MNKLELSWANQSVHYTALETTQNLSIKHDGEKNCAHSHFFKCRFFFFLMCLWENAKTTFYSSVILILPPKHHFFKHGRAV